jgi:NADPH:quinone reductase-like Zn-dependent oxidoreductase
VFGDSGTCGFGAFAEYVAVPESVLAQKPANILFEEAAAAVQAAKVALQALRDTDRIQKGQKVLVYGVSGGIGSFAVQIAKAFEAGVTAVCSTRNVKLARSLGADRVIDYTKEDFLKNGQRFDLILATAGYRSIFEFKRVLSPTGNYVATGGSMAGPKAMAQIFQAMLLGPLLSLTGRKKLVAMELSPSQNDLLVMKELLGSGQVKPVLDRGYALCDAAEALSYYSEGHTRGKVVISMVPSTKNLTNTEESI